MFLINANDGQLYTAVYDVYSNKFKVDINNFIPEGLKLSGDNHYVYGMGGDLYAFTYNTTNNNNSHNNTTNNSFNLQFFLKFLPCQICQIQYNLLQKLMEPLLLNVREK